VVSPEHTRCEQPRRSNRSVVDGRAQRSTVSTGDDALHDARARSLSLSSSSFSDRASGERLVTDAAAAAAAADAAHGIASRSAFTVCCHRPPARSAVKRAGVK